jgi:hypothetical protein
LTDNCIQKRKREREDGMPMKHDPEREREDGMPKKYDPIN